MKNRVFLDMDGVLCEYKAEASVEDMEEKGYFRNLRPRPAMIEAVKYLLENTDAEVFVLSAVLPQIKADATADKNAWLNEHLPMIDQAHRIFPVCGTDKAEAAGGVTKGDVLFDDYSANLAGWHSAGGTAVKILNEVNGKNRTFTSGPRLRVSRREDLYETLRMIS